jgi:thiol-disulfide isomerase/thioredoxin
MKLFQQLKKNWFTFLLILLIAVLFFVPNAKAFVLHGLIKTGVFNASVKKENIKIANPSTIFFINENGTRKNISALKGKVVFINFWATWCPSCVAEMPTINALYKKLKNDSNFIFIMADVDNDFQKSLSFMKKNNYNLPVYSLNGNIPAAIFEGTTPTTTIINPEGNIVQKHEGIANYDTEAMIDFLHLLIKQ